MKDFLPMILKSPAKINLTLDVKEKGLTAIITLKRSCRRYRCMMKYSFCRRIKYQSGQISLTCPMTRGTLHTAPRSVFEKTKIKGGADIKSIKKFRRAQVWGAAAQTQPP